VGSNKKINKQTVFSSKSKTQTCREFKLTASCVFFVKESSTILVGNERGWRQWVRFLRSSRSFFLGLF
jgi:hypothetical protein